MRRYEVEEKISGIMNQAETLGLQFDSGLIILEKAAAVDPEIAAAMVKELGTYLHYVHPRLQRCSTANRAKQLLGQRVWFQDRGEWVLGRLAAAEDNGLLVVSIDTPDYPVSQTVSVSPESVLIIMEEKPTSANQKERIGGAGAGVFERLRLRRSAEPPVSADRLSRR
jgi:hypothetical protein